MDPDDPDALRLARLASTGRLAMRCARELHSLLGRARSSPTAVQLHELLCEASELTRRLLTAGQRAGAESVVDLGEVVDGMRPLFGVLFPATTVVVVVRDAIGVRVAASRGDVEQLILNLIDGCEADRATTRRITIRTGTAAWYGTVSVSDDSGTAPADEPVVCVRCGSTHALGLPLSRVIATALGGGIESDITADGVEHCALLPLAPHST